MTGTVFPPARIVDRDRGTISTAQRRIAIVGAGRGRENAPFVDPTWCVTALNEIASPRFDIHFELHPRSVQSEWDFRCLRDISTPCYVLDPDEWAPGEIQRPVRYPLESIMQTFRRKYFTNTFAMEVALALWLGYQEIGLWGCGLFEGTSRERLVERACLDYWIGRAEGMGVRVVEDSMLAYQPFLYGKDYHDEKSEIERQVALCREVMEFERVHGPQG